MCVVEWLSKLDSLTSLICDVSFHYGLWMFATGATTTLAHFIHVVSSSSFLPPIQSVAYVWFDFISRFVFCHLFNYSAPISPSLISTFFVHHFRIWLSLAVFIEHSQKWWETKGGGVLLTCTNFATVQSLRQLSFEPNEVLAADIVSVFRPIRKENFWPKSFSCWEWRVDWCFVLAGQRWQIADTVGAVMMRVMRLRPEVLMTASVYFDCSGCDEQWESDEVVPLSCSPLRLKRTKNEE